jgi:hypothetical protein
MYNGKSAILRQDHSAATLEESKAIDFEDSHKEEAMKKYMIEREIPQVGSLQQDQLHAAAAKSNAALREIGPDVQWLESFVTADKTFCVYLAKDESFIQRHAELSGFPANKITEIGGKIDPSTGA